MRRPALPASVAATVVALAVLTACDNHADSRTAPPTEPAAQAVADPTGAAPTAVDPLAFDPADAVAKASKKPYAVSILAKVDLIGQTVTARQNFNTPVPTGRQERRTGSSTRDVVITADAQYSRIDGPTGTWTKMLIPMPSPWEFDLTGYAPVLLSLGPSARKGAETRDGVPVHHLSGHLDLDHLAKVSYRARDEAESVDSAGIDLDLWVDAQGRTRYAEKRMTVDGSTVVQTMAFSDFGPPETFAPPIVTAA